MCAPLPTTIFSNPRAAEGNPEGEDLKGGWLRACRRICVHGFSRFLFQLCRLRMAKQTRIDRRIAVLKLMYFQMDREFNQNVQI